MICVYFNYWSPNPILMILTLPNLDLAENWSIKWIFRSILGDTLLGREYTFLITFLAIFHLLGAFLVPWLLSPDLGLVWSISAPWAAKSLYLEEHWSKHELGFHIGSLSHTRIRVFSSCSCFLVEPKN